jgi:hypothetical protein
METSISNPAPNRVTDLIQLKNGGKTVTCRAGFEIVPVHFAQADVRFQAFVFLCHYSGTCGSEEYTFRKCYAKGCPHNLCPHVSQAVMVANRYLKRDFQRLKIAGIQMEETFFSLEKMLVKYDEIDLGRDPSTGGMLTIHDYINIAKEDNEVSVEVGLEFIPAVEHFANHKNEQTFLMADFTITTLGQSSHFQRCLACFSTALEKQEKPNAVYTANERLKLLFKEFDQADISYTSNYF